jgi:hypothetical protein
MHLGHLSAADLIAYSRTCRTVQEGRSVQEAAASFYKRAFRLESLSVDISQRMESFPFVILTERCRFQTEVREDGTVRMLDRDLS